MDWAWFDALIVLVDADFGQAASEKPTPQERPDLDKVFGG